MMQPDRARSRQYSFVTDRPVAVTMVFIAAIVFGYFSLVSLPVTLMPELSYPTLTVRTEYPGSAPEEVENDISRPLEEALGVVSGLKEISSISRAGVSDVVLKFSWGTDVSDATQDTLERLDRVRLPREAERPLILHFDPALDPVMELSFSGQGTRYEGDQGLRRLRRIAELQIKRHLEPIPGVAAVRLRGGLEEEIHVSVDENRLKRSGLDIQAVITRLAQENINVAGGNVIEGGAEYMVRTLNEFQDLNQIRDTIISYIEDRPVRIRDVAEVTLSFKEREILTSTEGFESVQVDIYKEADANMVSLAANIRAIVGELPKKAFVKEKAKKVDDQGFERKNKNGAAKAHHSDQAQRTDNNKNAKSGEKNRKTQSAKNAKSKGKPGNKKRRGRGQQLAPFLYKREGAKLQIVADRSTFIKNSISEVKQTALMGGLLAILVLYVFLRSFKSTVIIAVSIPISILITFAPMHLSGISLNIMSLGGLALGIGMLVDSSIVVLESIYRCREDGDNLKSAAIRGTAEVRGAVFASVLTSIAVFFPMVFVEGIAGQAFSDLGIAVVVSLLASFIVAVGLIPMLATRTAVHFRKKEPILSHSNTESSGNRFLNQCLAHFTCIPNFAGSVATLPRWAKLCTIPIIYFTLRFIILFGLQLVSFLVKSIVLLAALVVKVVLKPVLFKLFSGLSYFPLLIFQKGFDGIQRIYTPVLRWTLNNLLVVYLLIFACFYITYWLSSNVETELLPEVHQGEFTLEVQLPVGTPLIETHRKLSKIEDAILKNKQNIENLLVTYGYDLANSQDADEGEHTTKFKVILKANSDQKATEEKTLEELRRYFVNVPDAEIRVTRPALFSATTPIEVEIYGKDLSYLKTKTQRVKAELSGLSGITDVESSLKRGAPEIQVIYDRNKIIKYGLNVSDVAQSVRDMVKGFEATRFNKVDRRIPIVVRLEDEDRQAIESIRNLIVNPKGEQPIPLYAIAELQIGEGPSEVRRIDGNRVGLITANLDGTSLSEVALLIESTLNNTMTWNDGTSFSVTGQSEEWDESKNSLLLALALSVFLVYVIMAAQFESLIHPLIIMFSIPMAFVGTFAGLWLLKVNLSIVVVLGMIMLTGLVVNNAIVFVDYINTLRAKGMLLNEAIQKAGEVRLRPILMTTTTTVLGLLPMAFGAGDGAEIRTPMAIAVITGLLSSTFLTLLIIPAIYGSVERLKLALFTTSDDQVLEPASSASG